MTTCQMLLVSCVLTGAATGQDPRLTMPARIPPAALLDVSGSLINAVVERKVERMEPVRDHILDADVHGTSHMRGIVEARLQPDPERAFLSFVFRGTSHSDTVGLQDPAMVYTHTIMHFEVHQPIAIETKGVRAYPTTACAKAQTCLVRITNMKDDPESIVVGVARLTFFDDRPQIEAISARHAEYRLSTGFCRELRPQIEKAAKGLHKALNVFADLGVSMDPLRWSSTATHLHGEAGLVSSAPMTMPPPLRGGDLNLRVHQSVLESMAQKSLAGKTYSALDLAGLRERIMNILNSDPKLDASSLDPSKLGQLLKTLGLEPASITFARKNPVVVDLHKGGFTLTLRGSEFAQSTRKFPARNILARYTIQGTFPDVTFLRQGSVQIVNPGPFPDLDEAKDKEMRGVLEKSFNFFMPARLVLPRITIPITPPIVLAPNLAETQDGWLMLGWTRMSTLSK